MDIKPLDKKTYAGRKFTARYHTNGYYDICPDERGFQVQYKLFDAPVERSFCMPTPIPTPSSTRCASKWAGN